MDTVLVTGGVGYIGSQTCKLLHQSGFTPVAFDNLSTGNKENAKWGPLVRGDVHDRDQLKHAIKLWQPVCVIHFAASAYVGESTVDPRKYYNNNVAGILSLLDTCIEVKLRNIVFSSSCATYGIPTKLPIAEGSPQVPINPYGRTKLIGEMMLKDYASAYSLRYVALRYFNAAGADIDGELRERHDPETHLIPRALMAAAGRISELIVFGDDYDTPDGTCIRDYVHVTDLAQAHVSAVQHLIAGGKNMVANLGSGQGTSVQQIIDTIERLTQRRVPVRREARREGDPPALYSDFTVAQSELHFTPRFSDIETIIRTAAPTFGLEVANDILA
ncbi:UDP-glucose 4-epimerase [Pararhizobium polonicum]|uniref:UDP-glucose 4-epimerase n=1 Tax=Pararhizobium polonicum TaxID=1612624 RepID=A0A1C7NSX6_9HYPH|nr:UDP-glucose 4-epimerase GalE [Pararhizobium polonicum]OBZ92115.1 UDP-glucose 4-epimerase [Pararhizobium polonicum]